MAWIIITGISSGIGRDTTSLLLENGCNVIGTVRDIEDANELLLAWPNTLKVLTLDVSSEDSIDHFIKNIKLEGLPIFALINNAGIAVSGPSELLPIPEIKQQFQVNVFGLISITQKIIPFLNQHNGLSPRIINISSVSGRITNAFMGPYSASKFAVEAFSDALRRELSLKGIKVVIIQPGPIKTPIWEKARKDKFDWSNTSYGKVLENRKSIIDHTEASAINVREVSNAILKSLNQKNPKTRKIVAAKAWIYPLLQLLPDKWLDKILIKANGIRKI